ncbi:TPA: hypothetical protein ACXP4C_001508 [Klebsiella pneumoniae]
MNIETVNELIASLESAGELSIREQKFLKLAKEFRICSASLDTVIKTGNVLADQNSQLAAENVALKESRNNLAEFIHEELDADYPLNMNLETHATDRIVAAQRSAFVDEAVSKITESGALTLGDCIVALCQLREGASE